MIKVMQHYADGGEVENKNKESNKWFIGCTPVWNWAKYDYRIKKFQYPMWFKANSNGLIIKFDGLESGTVVEEGNSFYKKGDYNNNWVSHTDSEYWEEIEEPKSKQTIIMEKWLMRRNDEYYICTTNKIDNYKPINSSKVTGNL